MPETISFPWNGKHRIDFVHNASYVTDLEDPKRFPLHMHTLCELYVFVSGKADYIVESNRFHLLPGDVILTQPNELHRVKLLSQTAQEIRQKILDGMTGQTVTLLTETYEDGVVRGHTDSFVEVAFPTEHFGHAEVVNVRILGNNGTLCHGERIQPMKGEA